MTSFIPGLIENLQAMVHVHDVDRSVAFYRQMGFELTSSVENEEGVTVWVALQSNDAAIMFTLASEPVVAAQQAVLFYLYTADIAGLRRHLMTAGIAPGEIAHPPHMPAGEMRLTDPDGYCLLIGQMSLSN